LFRCVCGFVFVLQESKTMLRSMNVIIVVGWLVVGESGAGKIIQ
jgi:hypothetical protein